MHFICPVLLTAQKMPCTRVFEKPLGPQKLSKLRPLSELKTLQRNMPQEPGAYSEPYQTVSILTPTFLSICL